MKKNAETNLEAKTVAQKMVHFACRFATPVEAKLFLIGFVMMMFGGMMWDYLPGYEWIVQPFFWLGILLLFSVYCRWTLARRSS